MSASAPSVTAHYWLVGNKSTFISGHTPGKASKVSVIESIVAPKQVSSGAGGYQYVADLGPITQDKNALYANAAHALMALPNWIAVPSSLTFPGIGKVPVNGACGIPGTLDKAVTTAGNVASVAQLFAQGGTWKGIAMIAGGAILILLGLFQMAGHSAGSVAAVPARAAAKVPA
jgi:hypothetical protein